jgi:hypothetical protein
MIWNAYFGVLISANNKGSLRYIDMCAVLLYTVLAQYAIPYTVRS